MDPEKQKASDDFLTYLHGDEAQSGFQRFGYRVIEADSAERALDLLEGLDDTVHLLLTDVVLPRMDGPHLAESVIRKRPATRVLLMSGYAAGFENRNTAAAANSSAAPYLPKGMVD